MTRKLGRKLRLGMVGGGPGAFIGAVHRAAARLDGHWELVAGALSASPDKARSHAAELMIPRAYGSFEEMAEAERSHPEPIDAVAIVTPNHMHYPVATAFLDAGFHVICDKPLTTTVDDALQLTRQVEASGLIFGLTHTYSGYPMVRQMREMVLNGDIGPVRMIQVEYAQGWLATPLEETGAKQAEWRTDPARSGPGGCLGDIATHAYHLARFTTELKPREISADLTTFVRGRRLDDNVQALVRFDGGAKASLWSSQIAVGEENNLNIRIYGETGSLAWHQENPNYVQCARLGESTRVLTRGGPGNGLASTRSTRIPTGHPEGYYEAFAQLYNDFSELVRARLEEREPHGLAKLLPTCADGLAGLRFIDGAIRSAQDNSAWTTLG